MNQTPAIDAQETINALLARHPEALPVLQRFGLDACCGGALTLAEAARHHGLRIDELLAALDAVMAPAAAGAARP
jgi:iron-sulfur cluster repair protein YtfE (RIC family)